MASAFSSVLAGQVVLAGPAVLTGAVLEAAAWRIVDTVGVTLAGCQVRDGRWMADLLLEQYPADAANGALVLGRSRRLVPSLAAIANGVAAHALDYDDTNNGGGVHVGSVVVPAVLALAQTRGTSGPECLAAVACGYQTAALLGRLSRKSFGGSHSAAAALFGAVAACARVLGLSAAQAAHAFGLGGSFVAGTSEYFASGSGDNKQIQHGHAAGNAITAALLAERGAQGPAAIFEGPLGVFKERARMDFPREAMDADLWDTVEVLLTSVKPFPACHCVVPFASTWTTLLTRMRAEGIDPFKDVEAITCLATPISEKFMLHPISVKRAPGSAHQGRFSLPWCLGKIALDGALGPAAFDMQWITHPQILSLAQRVDYELVDIDPQRARKDEIQGGVRVRMRGGRTMEEFSWGHRGGPSDPLSNGEISAKFMEASEGSGSFAARALVLREILALAQAASLAPLTSALQACI
ncbi:MAG: MmgE/PrpD family protein [Pseudomonadota bacterium]